MKISEKELEKILEELRQLVTEMGATVRFEKGDFKGGYCVLKESKLIIINKNAHVRRKIVILGEALRELGIENVFITPRLREIIEEFTEI